MIIETPRNLVESTTSFKISALLGKITTGKKVKKLDCLSIAEVVDMDVEVAGNEEFVRGGGCMGEKR